MAGWRDAGGAAMGLAAEEILGVAYLKLTVVEELLIISFKEKDE